MYFTALSNLYEFRQKQFGSSLKGETSITSLISKHSNQFPLLELITTVQALHLPHERIKNQDQLS